MTIQPHLKIDASQISPYVLMPGDPARVDQIGKLLDDFEVITSNREFRVGVGGYKGKKITICSTGIGCPSTAITTEELINAGAKVMIRVGTCGGGWRQDVELGSIVIPTASIRDEGTTLEYIEKGFPAVADFEVVQALQKSAEQNKQKYFVGINRTHDAFYGSTAAVNKWGGYLLDEKWLGYDTPILSSEMESAALFIIATLRGVKAGAVLAVNAEPEPLKLRLRGEKQEVVAETSPEHSLEIVEKMIRVALEALAEL